MSEWMTFDGKEFGTTQCPLSDDAPSDWGAALQGIGYELLTHLGDEFSVFEVYIRSHRQNGSFLIEPWLGGDCGFGFCVCKDETAAMAYIAHYCAPLLRLNCDEAARRFFERADAILFDPDLGLQCAQDYGARERQRAEATKARRGK